MLERIAYGIEFETVESAECIKTLQCYRNSLGRMFRRFSEKFESIGNVRLNIVKRISTAIRFFLLYPTFESIDIRTINKLNVFPII